MSFDLKAFYANFQAWSLETIGPLQSPAGVIAHLRKEVEELRRAIEANDGANIREELADIAILAIDLSWRAGGSAEDFGGFGGRIAPADALRYIFLHLSSKMTPPALAVLLWDIAFRALGSDPAPIVAKHAVNKARTWPDWRTIAPDQPIEHVRKPVTANISGAAHDPAAVAADVQDGIRGILDRDLKPGSISAFAPTSTAKVLVREVAPGAAVRSDDLMSIADLVADWRNRGERLDALNRTIKDVLYPDTAKALGVQDGECVRQAAKRVAAERDSFRESDRTLKWLHDHLCEILDCETTTSSGTIVAKVAALAGARAEWTADNERLRSERQSAREALGAKISESLVEAAKRAAAERDRASDDLDMIAAVLEARS